MSIHLIKRLLLKHHVATADAFFEFRLPAAQPNYDVIKHG